MNLAEFLDAMRTQAEVTAGSAAHLKMHELSQQALQITARINGAYHTPEELFSLMQDMLSLHLITANYREAFPIPTSSGSYSLFTNGFPTTLMNII